MEDSKSEKIRKLNDAFRKTGLGGVIVLTQGIQSQSAEIIEKIAREVMNFSRFIKDNDPFGEHDFGSFEVEQLKLFWKIDYYNLDMDGGSENPTDPKITKRVLTVMLREEY